MTADGPADSSASTPPVAGHSGPLSGVRVLEFGQIAAGPFCAMLLADLGADVVKVEKPDGGDDMRRWPPMSEGPDASAGRYSENFASVNRNKRSIAVDLKDAEAVAGLRRLAAVADVIVENFRPGVLDRLGLGYDALRAQAPRLVYTSLTGYGQTGPYAGRGAFDVTIQAVSGLMSVTGEPGGAAVKAGVPVGDFVAGLYAAYTTLAAVMAARTTGQGTRVDCSMLGGLLGIAQLQTSEFFGTGRIPQPLGSAHPRNAPYRGFHASDAPFVIAAGNDKLWHSVCEAVGFEGLKDDERFATQEQRARNQAELFDLLQPVFGTKPVAHWLAEFDRRGVPYAPINDYAEILDDPQVAHLGLVHPMTLPNGRQTRTVGFPVQVAGFDFRVYRQPPALGEHNEEVQREWLG
ncbi:MAG: CaiB/BaiF CoA transferase family protein [bacterium]|jgi:succinate--hydroxymethylglutarate CoA-transferase|nr:CoA transferase [Rhodocyclaceae bacterium]MCA4903436.1 CoA transferase [Rhodocyclaceae bacterium]MCE2979250.1 CoA transferase [Betaproteobacteria bacterium]